MGAAKPENTPLALVIRDGWGRNPNPEHDACNAVKLARTPTADALERDWPTTLIRTSGEAVGLPDGTMGNSEVGHQNIGAGRVVDQDSMRITNAIRAGVFFENAALVGAIRAAGRAGKAVHLMGVCSDAGVHGQLEHLYACLELCERLGQDRVFVHCFTDGRDTGPFTGKGYLAQVASRCAAIGVGRIVSVCGRYYAMDRDNRWARTRRAYACLTGQGVEAADVRFAESPQAAAQAHYDTPVDGSMRGDEFVEPTMIAADAAAAAGSRICAGDAVIFYNYRGDRPRQLVRAFVDPGFQRNADPDPETGERGFDRALLPDLCFVTMAAYAQDLNAMVEVAFPRPQRMPAILGEYVAGLGLTQFRCAETEKFPHVTFFFNDYRDEPFDGERRAILQSPKDVATYDQRPEMSAHAVRDAVLGRLGADDCEPLIVVNFANGDMVGHTGSLDAAIAACETVDACVGTIVDQLLAIGGAAIVTADHGNAEQMWDPEHDCPHTAHTLYDVPLSVVGDAFKGCALRTGGALCDIAPTALAMLGLAQPPEMTGRSLLEPLRCDH